MHSPEPAVQHLFLSVYVFSAEAVIDDFLNASNLMMKAWLQ